MLVSKQSPLAQFINYQSMSIRDIISDCNGIGAEGCLYLSNSHWPSLKDIILGKINLSIGNSGIGDEGCSNLSKGCWFNLQTIELSKDSIYIIVKNNIGPEGC